MTRRKPLTWYVSEFGPEPDCGPCLDHLLSTPHLHEAFASVAIEHPTTSDQLMRSYMNHFHDNRHQETR